MQIITPGRLAELKTKLSYTEIVLEWSQLQPSGEKFEELYKQYIKSCNSCVDWINKRYNSVPDLIDFMRRDIKSRAQEYGIEMDEKLAWKVRPFSMPPGHEAVGTVQMLNAIVDYIYPSAEGHLNRRIQYLQDNQPELPQTYGPE